MAKLKRVKESSLSTARPKSYEEYIREAGIDYRGEYATALRDARLTAARERVGYGASGEKIGSMGLLGSGYSEYLGQVAADGQKSRLSSLSEKKRESSEEARQGYSDYLADYERDQTVSAKSMSLSPGNPTIRSVVK